MINSKSEDITFSRRIIVKKCPFCAEKIKNDAIVCRYCGKEIPKEETPQPVEHPKNKLNKYLGVLEAAGQIEAVPEQRGIFYRYNGSPS